MQETIYTGIDIGSRNLKIMSLSFNPENNKTKILHKLSFPTRGITDGYVSNPDLFNQSFSDALKKYQKDFNLSVKEAIFTIDPVGLKSKKIKINHSTVNQSHISEVDINEIERKINLTAEKNISGTVLESRLIKYKINGYDYFSDIQELESKKIESEYLVIYLPANHLSTLEKIFTRNDVSILDIKSGSVSSSEINSEKSDKDLGFISIDIGADKTSLSVWENNTLICLDNISFGSDDISKKISMENKIPFSEAENLKKNFRDNVKVEKIIKNSWKKLANEIKEKLIELEKHQLLPAGAIIYGGGSKEKMVKEIFKDILSLPIKKYKKDISDSNTDYSNIYAGIISYILVEKNTPFIKITSLKNLIKKIFKK